MVGGGVVVGMGDDEGNEIRGSVSLTLPRAGGEGCCGWAEGAKWCSLSKQIWTLAQHTTVGPSGLIANDTLQLYGELYRPSDTHDTSWNRKGNN